MCCFWCCCEFGEERYFRITKRIYQELDNRLKDTNFLAGEKYTIADIATWPWIARHEWHDIGLKNFKNLSRWYSEISKRDAVVKGYQFMNKEELPPQPWFNSLIWTEKSKYHFPTTQ